MPSQTATRTDQPQTAATPVARYRKTQDGSWVVMAPAKLALEAKRTGTITVTKADGTTKTEPVTTYGKRFQVDGQPFVYIRLPEKPWQKAGRTGRPGHTGDAPRGQRCENSACGRWAHVEATDMSGLGGWVCYRCEADGMLSFA